MFILKNSKLYHFVVLIKDLGKILTYDEQKNIMNLIKILNDMN